MTNASMLRKLEAGKCVDVSECKRTFEGDYILDGVEDGADYCDAKAEQWIWSIGRRRNDGIILASTTSKFYGNPDFECIWLR